MSNPLPGKLDSACALLGKLKREQALLEDEVTSDRLYNFAVTAYSLIDWIKNDPAVPQSAKDVAVSGQLHKDPWLKICGDIATASKHFALNTRTPITGAVSSQQGWGMGRWGKGGYGVGEEDITIQLLDGTQISLWQLIPRVVAVWDAYFATHKIPC